MNKWVPEQPSPWRKSSKRGSCYGDRVYGLAIPPVEVRCYMFVKRCLARSTRCNTMSHLTADAVCLYTVSRESPDVTPCHTSPPQGVVVSVRQTTVSFHYFKSQNLKLSFSNPKSKYVAYLSVLFQISNCQGLGRRNKHDILKTDRMADSARLPRDAISTAAATTIDDWRAAVPNGNRYRNGMARHSMLHPTSTRICREGVDVGTEKIVEVIWQISLASCPFAQLRAT